MKEKNNEKPVIIPEAKPDVDEVELAPFVNIMSRGEAEEDQYKIVGPKAGFKDTGKDLSWIDSAPCAEMDDPDLFIGCKPEATKICHEYCGYLTMLACLTRALDTGQVKDVAGGFTPRQIKKLFPKSKAEEWRGYSDDDKTFFCVKAISQHWQKGSNGKIGEKAS